MDSSENPFAIAPGGPGFEDLAFENGFRFWWASDLSRLLGYGESQTFRKAVDKAMQVCIQLNVPVAENIRSEMREIGGRHVEDFKMSRFACYLAAMNGDVRKPEVAQAQAYFVTFAEACRLALTEPDGVERVVIRGDLTDRERSLSSIAKQSGVTSYALFQNAGYRGLYNMDLSKLKNARRVPSDRSPLDFMGKTELAANLFRLTQTEERIKNRRITGQKPLEDAAETVGQNVRKAMQTSSGTSPEHLLPAEDIKTVRKQIKATQRTFRKVDSPNKKLPKKRST